MTLHLWTFFGVVLEPETKFQKVKVLLPNIFWCNLTNLQQLSSISIVSHFEKVFNYLHQVSGSFSHIYFYGFATWFNKWHNGRKLQNFASTTHITRLKLLHNSVILLISRPCLKHGKTFFIYTSPSLFNSTCKLKVHE